MLRQLFHDVFILTGAAGALAQVATPDFFMKLLPRLDGGDDVGMVLSPQSFNNLRPHADIFNHGNVQFWEYAQHGYDAIGFISCTGAARMKPFAALPMAGSRVFVGL